MTNVTKRIVVGLVSIATLTAMVVYPVASFHKAQAEEFDPVWGSEDEFDPIWTEPDTTDPQDGVENIIEDVTPPEEGVTNIIEQPEVPERPVPEIPEKAAIKVIKFKDVNGNGLEDAGEPRMNGVTFHLDENAQAIGFGGGGHRIAQTDANGVILWLDVALTSHVIREEVPSGFVVTTQNPVTIIVSAGQTVVVKFGNQPVVIPNEARLEIIKIRDENANGTCEKGEPAMAGVRFSIKKDGQVVTSGTTNVAGLVEFDLDPGTYLIIEDVPAGFRVVGDNPRTVVLDENEDEALLFCNTPVTEEKADILVIKFKDLNGNGVQDAGEPRLSGVAFTTNGGMQKTTNANGEARWITLDLGTYTVVEQVPAGFRATTATTQTATLTTNGQTVTLIFGNQPVELPPTGAMNIFLPSALGMVSTLYTMIRRQRKYAIDLLRGL